MFSYDRLLRRRHVDKSRILLTTLKLTHDCVKGIHPFNMSKFTFFLTNPEILIRVVSHTTHLNLLIVGRKHRVELTYIVRTGAHWRNRRDWETEEEILIGVRTDVVEQFTDCITDHGSSVSE